MIRCRRCKQPGTIASVDRYIGTCHGELLLVNGELVFEPAGYTEIHWDSCEQIGWSCRECFTEESMSNEADLIPALHRLVEIAREE